MVKLNKTCCVCGNKYSYCPSCGNNASKPSWMASFCSEDCKKVYEAAAAFNMNKMSAEEARCILDTCDLSNKEHFTPSTKKIIGEIYGVAKIEVDNFSVMESSVVDDADVVVSNADAVVINSYNSNFSTTSVEKSAKQMNYKKKKKKRKND